MSANERLLDDLYKSMAHTIKRGSGANVTVGEASGLWTLTGDLIDCNMAAAWLVNRGLMLLVDAQPGESGNVVYTFRG